MSSERPNISNDLIWEIVRNQNAFLVKRNSGGGVQFSRDPFNLTNKHSRKHAGFVNDKSICLVPSSKGGVTLHTKKSKAAYKPGSHNTTTHFNGKSTRKIYKGVADSVGKKGYRGDLNRDAINRASAIKYSQRPKKDTPEKKLRGSKAKKAEE